jgi:DNA-binding transcriptional MerR regulator
MQVYGRAMMRDREEFSIADVQDLTGVSGRTIRYYVSQGLIPPAHGRGPSAKYDRGHLVRLNAIQRMKSERLALDEIKSRLDGLSDRQIATLVESDVRPSGENWRRIALHPDIELHVRHRPMPEGHDLEEAIKWILDTIRPTIERMRTSGNGRRG